MFYLGVKTIKSTEELEERKTPLGNVLIEVEFETGEKEMFPKAMYDRLVSLQPRPLEEYVHLRAAIFADLIFSILQEYGLKWGEFMYVSTLLKTSVEKHREAADKVLYGKPRDEVTMLDIQEILKDKRNILDDILRGGI